jgi:hypothetical protein
MPEFSELRDRLRQVRSQLDASAAAVASAEEQLRRIQASETELARVFDSAVPSQKPSCRARVTNAATRRRQRPRSGASSPSSRFCPMPFLD